MHDQGWHNMSRSPQLRSVTGPDTEEGASANGYGSDSSSSEPILETMRKANSGKRTNTQQPDMPETRIDEAGSDSSSGCSSDSSTGSFTLQRTPSKGKRPAKESKGKNKKTRKNAENPYAGLNLQGLKTLCRERMAALLAEIQSDMKCINEEIAKEDAKLDSAWGRQLILKELHGVTKLIKFDPLEPFYKERLEALKAQYRQAVSM
jgi:hypothetical protein